MSLAFRFLGGSISMKIRRQMALLAKVGKNYLRPEDFFDQSCFRPVDGYADDLNENKTLEVVFNEVNGF